MPNGNEVSEAGLIHIELLDRDVHFESDIVGSLRALSHLVGRKHGTDQQRELPRQPTTIDGRMACADRHLALTAAYAHFFAGEFLKQTPPGKDVDSVSTWATYKF